MDAKIIALLDVTEKAYNTIDHYCEEIPNVCQSGCSHCCKQIVDVLNWEDFYILKYVAFSGKISRDVFNKIRANIKEWFRKFESMTRPATRSNPLTLYEYEAVRRKFREHKIPCPFLIDDQCSIYEARPLMCRSHFVESDPDKCRTDPHRHGSEHARLGFNGAFAMFEHPDINEPRYFTPLPYVVVPAFIEDYQTKPIAVVDLSPLRK